MGSFQNILREVHVPLLHRMKIPVLRRMTGGGTVYHDLGNVNYTYIINQNEMMDYDRCLQPIIKALNDTGVPARKNRSCDIAVGDKKISGSAQRVAGGRILHHGTLLFKSDLKAVDKITTHYKNEDIETKGTVSAICNVTNICDHLEEPMTLEKFKSRLLENMLTPESKCITLTEEQKRQVCSLRDEKYHSWDWIWGKNPAFTYKKTGKFADTPIYVEYKVKHGILMEAVVRCDALDEVKAACRLNGSRLEPEEILSICKSLAGEQAEALMDFFM